MTWPTVTEHPLRLEPTSRDPFLDGLTDELAWREPPTTTDPVLCRLRRRALAVCAADVATRASAFVPGPAPS